MIHRALFGSFERFIGILLEHLGGELPVWLAPVQAIVLPITDHQNEARGAVSRRSPRRGLRAELDDRSESVGRKIRDAELRKIPYMLVVGEREAAAGTVAVRERGAGDAGVVAVDGVRRSGSRETDGALALTRVEYLAIGRAPRYTRRPWPSHHTQCRAASPLDART